MLSLLLEIFLSVFGRVIIDAIQTWKASEDARALGHTEAVQDAALEAIKIERDMGAVELPERGDLLKRLREGLA